MSNETKRLYEAMFLVDTAVATADWDSITGAIGTVLDRAEAEVVSVRKWEEARLAYPIKRCTRGTYILAYFKAGSSVITGIERDVKLNETFLRVLVLNGEHLTEDMMNAATPTMKANDAARLQEEAAAKAKEEAAAKAAEAAAAAEAAEAEANAKADPAVEPFDDIPETVEEEPQAEKTAE